MRQCVLCHMRTTSATEMPTYLTLGTHMDSALMYHIYWNRAAGAYS